MHKAHRSDVVIKNRKGVDAPPPGGTGGSPVSIASLSASLIRRLEACERGREGEEEQRVRHGKLIDVDDVDEVEPSDDARLVEDKNLSGEKSRAVKRQSTIIPYFYEGTKWGPNDG